MGVVGTGEREIIGNILEWALSSGTGPGILLFITVQSLPWSLTIDPQLNGSRYSDISRGLGKTVILPVNVGLFC